MIQETVSEKALPRSLEAEQAVLGSLLLDSAAMSMVLPILREEDFYSDDHRRIYRAMLELFLRSGEVDVLTIKEELDTATDQRISAAYLASLLDAVPETANVEHYARIVKEKSTLRRLIFAGRHAIQEGMAGEKSAEQVLGEITGEIF